MNNFAQKQDWTMYCKIPSRRWKISRIRKANDKRLRNLYKRYNQLLNEIRDLGYEALDKPIRCGYKRLFILDDDQKHSPNYQFYEGILDKINEIRYSPTKEFETKKSSKRKRRRKRKEQKLKELDQHSFNKYLKFTEDEKRMFYRIRFYNHQRKQYEIKYIFSEPWRFRLSTQPHWITEIKRKDQILEQQAAEIAEIILKDKNQARLTKMRGEEGYPWKKFYEERENKTFYSYNSVKHKPLHLVMEEYYNEIEK